MLNPAIGGESLVNSANQILLVGLCGAGLLLAMMRYRRIIAAFRRDSLLVMLLAYVVVSCMWSQAPALSVARAVTLTAAAVAAVYSASRFEPHELFGAVAAASVALVILNLSFLLLLPEQAVMEGYHEGAWRGIFGQKNSLARVMALAVPILLIGIRARKHILIYGLGAVGAGALLLGTRSATGLAVTVALVIGLPLIRWVRVRKELVVPLAIVATITGAAVVTVLIKNLAAIIQALGRDPTLTGRTYVWHHVVSAIMERPVQGYGYGGFWLGWEGPSRSIWAAGDWSPNDSHNGFLDLLLDLGLIGGVLFLIHLTWTGALAIRAYRRRGIVLEWIAVVIAHFVMYNITESAILRPTNLMFFLYVMIATTVRRNDLRAVIERTHAGYRRNSSYERPCQPSYAARSA